MIEFIIPGQPVPKQRARRGAGGRWYTPSATRSYERSVGQFGAVARQHEWPDGARYSVEVECHFSDNRRRDIDNVVKSVLDGLNGVLWVDDHQVSEVSARRHFDKTNPRTCVRVRVIT